jgi:hypothetical protein
LIGGDKYFPDRINERNDKTILEHIGEAYNWLASTLKESQYESTFINPKFVECVDIKDATFCSLPNRYKRVLEDQFGFVGRSVFDEKAIRYFAIFKAAPFSIKPLVYRSSGWTDALEGSQQLATSVNKRYYEYLMLRSLPQLSSSLDELPSQFNFLWNSELIAPMNLGADCEPLGSGRSDMYSHETRINATRCVLGTLQDWFRWMKDNGVYDNTKIIIAADHGAGRYDKDWYKRAVNPMLLVKEINARGPLQTSDVLMQNSDVAALICAELGGCEGILEDPSKAPARERTAKYFYTTHGNYSFAQKSRRFEIKQVFEVRGDVREDPAFEW